MVDTEQNRIHELEQELEVTEKILAERQKVLEAIPECEDHGFCVPHALEWIESQKGNGKRNNH